VRSIWAIIIIIVSLASSVSGHGMACADECGDARQQTVIQHESGGGGMIPSELPHGCNCVCHHPAPLVAEIPVAFSSATPAPLMLAGHAGEFPPDAVPAGIDHPPQLA
jgi:hypothetical protein